MATNPTQLRKAASGQMSIIDQIRVALQAKGEQDIYFNLADFAGSIGLRASTFYQALYRLGIRKELDILTETTKDGRHRITGVHLIKLESPSKVIGRALTRPIDTTKLTRKTLNKIQDKIPGLLAYQNKKNIVDSVRTQLFEAGFDPEAVLKLPAESDLAEEGILVWKEYCDAQKRIAELETQVELMGRMPQPAIEVERIVAEPVMV
jgi:hypothetical protein